MTLSNGFIYNCARQLMKFNENPHNEMSVILNYYIQSNANKIIEAGMEIEKSIQFIQRKYGEPLPDDSTTYKIKKEFEDQAQKELNDLANIKQNIEIQMIKLSDLKDVKLSTEELQSILFMIEDDLSNQEEKKEES